MNHSSSKNNNFLLTKSRYHQAILNLRQAGLMEHLVRGLIARCELWRSTNDIQNYHKDIIEAIEIAEQSNMELMKALCLKELSELSIEDRKEFEKLVELDKMTLNIKPTSDTKFFREKAFETTKFIIK